MFYRYGLTTEEGVGVKNGAKNIFYNALDGFIILFKKKKTTTKQSDSNFR